MKEGVCVCFMILFVFSKLDECDACDAHLVVASAGGMWTTLCASDLIIESWPPLCIEFDSDELIFRSHRAPLLKCGTPNRNYMSTGSCTFAVLRCTGSLSGVLVVQSECVSRKMVLFFVLFFVFFSRSLH
jgi:hypothetical protein